MNQFCKTMVLPVAGTLFKTQKEKGADGKSTQDVVKFLCHAAGTGGDRWIVEYITGSLKGTRSSLDAFSLKDHKPVYKFKKKKVSATVHVYQLNKKYKLVKLYSHKIEVGSTSLKKIQEEIKKTNPTGDTIKYLDVHDFANLSQKEMVGIVSGYNQRYFKWVMR
jgi:hypothetical protein